MHDGPSTGLRPNIAQQFIAGLLQGRPPDASQIARCGPWQEMATALADAHQKGGTAAVRQVFHVLARQDATLARLVAADPEPAKVRWRADELFDTEFPELRWSVPGILPEGLAILAGKPKIGKSWLALSIAHAVGSGTEILGRQVEAGNVLYIALEDSPRRLRDRLISQQARRGTNVEFATHWPYLDKGGLAELQDEIERNSYSLVVIDTFNRSLLNSDQNKNSDMTAVLGNLQQMALFHRLTMLILDHHNKAFDPNSDPIQALYGSTAKAGVADLLAGLFKEPGKQELVMKLTGREIDEQSLLLSWEEERCLWHLVGDAAQVRKETNKDVILQAVLDLDDNGELPTTTSVAEFVNMDRGNVSRLLGELVTDGRLRRGERQGKIQPYLPILDDAE